MCALVSIVIWKLVIQSSSNLLEHHMVKWPQVALTSLNTIIQYTGYYYTVYNAYRLLLYSV